MKNSKNYKNKQGGTTRRRASLKRRPWILVVILIVLAALVAAAYFLCFHPGTTDGDTAADSDDISSSLNPKGVSSSQDAKSSSLNDIKSDKTPEQASGEDPNTLDEITGFVSYSAVNDDHLSIRLTINQFFESTGTCELTLSKDGVSKTYTAQTFNNPSYSTCQGFDVPLSDLSDGHWDVSVKVTADGKQGTITGGADL